MYHLYAEDSQIYDITQVETDVKIRKFESCTEDIQTWMQENKLKLNGEKTEALIVGSKNSLKISKPGFHSNRWQRCKICEQC